MASISITIPDNKVNDVLDAFATTFGWRSSQLDGTKAEFAKRMLMNYIREIVVAHKTEQASLTARQNAAGEDLGMS
jgi:hypothetical protein